MEKTNTNTYRQYAGLSGEEELEMRYKIVSIENDDLYISLFYPEKDSVESRYDPKFNGWDHASEIDESDLPDDHLDKLEDIREKLSRKDSESAKDLGKVKI